MTDQLDFDNIKVDASPFGEGYSTAMAGSNVACPYHPDSAAAVSWYNGFSSAQEEKKHLAVIQVASALNDVRLHPLHHFQAGHISLAGVLWIMAVIIIVCVTWLVGVAIGLSGGV